MSLEQSATFGAARLLMLIMVASSTTVTTTTLGLSRQKVRRQSRLTTSALAAEMIMMKVVPLDIRPMKLRYLFMLRRKQLPFTVIGVSST